MAGSAPVTATFSTVISTTAVSTTTFSVHGAYTAVYTGTYSFPAVDALHFAPAQPFKPCETLFATGSSGVQSDLGTPLRPYTWQFTAAAGEASGVMSAHLAELLAGDHQAPGIDTEGGTWYI